MAYIDPRLIVVARKLGDLLDTVVFIGGSILGILVTDAAAPTPRPTKYVDVVSSAVSYSHYQALEQRLRDIGFTNDQSDGAPICRYVIDGILVDVMPSDSTVLGWKDDRWLKKAFDNAITVKLQPGLSIRVVNAPCFIAMKLQAFADRGNGDYFGSKDLEDIVSTLAGRPDLLKEFAHCDPDIRSFVSSEVAELMATERFRDALPGHLTDDPMQAPVVLERMQSIVDL